MRLKFAESGNEFHPNFGYYGLLRVWHEVSYLETRAIQVIDVRCVLRPAIISGYMITRASVRARNFDIINAENKSLEKDL